MKLKEARQLLVQTLKEVEHKKDIDFFNFWIEGLLWERRLLCESFTMSGNRDTFLWSIVVERIGEIDRTLDSRWIQIHYMFYKQIMKHRKTFTIILPTVDKLRQLTPPSPYWGMYDSREKKWNNDR